MTHGAPQADAVPPSVAREAFLTVLGSGYAPFASGSWGSLAACVMFAGLWFAASSAPIRTLGAPTVIAGAATALGILVASILSIRWGAWAIARWGRKDPKPFVLDEFAGQWVALLALPPAAVVGWWPLACFVGSQFVLFRLFDVVKPPPARQIDRNWPAGWGILCDDLVAGLYALIVGQVLWRATPLPGWIG